MRKPFCWRAALAFAASKPLFDAFRSTDGRFSLELWQFYESFQESISLKTGTFSSTARRSSVRRQDLRVTLSGHYKLKEVPSVRFSGFSEDGLNQVFALETGLTVSDRPTWWSQDGLYFIYFAQEYQHWKVNGLRSVGGDGISSVRPGGRRAGCGFAHSGEAKGHNEVGALLEPQGWFEADDDEWVGVTLSLTTRRASSLRFIAEIARTQESAKVNETSTTEHALGRCMFCGLRFEQAILVFVPPKPGSEEDTGLIADWSAAESFELGDMDDKLLKETGEPDVIQLKPRRSMSKL
ncbi:unnamed protein product [Durusdinium trenchii]|uniref:Uncharacterized protein n=1 Tax=Durusdinium trenchii TaxID=1381693 RepID=A0ABP0LPK1_9DINO